MAKNKKSQTWVFDFILAITIFSVALIIFYKTLPNIERQQLDNLDNTYIDANILADSLFSKGLPKNWNKSNVIYIGIMDNNTNISAEKTSELKNLTINNYSITKSKFNIISDYFVFFSYANQSPAFIGNTCCFGNKHVSASYNSTYITSNITSLKTDNIVHISRIAMYNKTPVKLNIFVWS